jgi:YbbR domain-containing protein
VRVSGPGVILSGLDPKRMRTPLDLSGVRPGVATYAISPKMFQLPRKVEVVRVTPAQVSLQIDRLSKRQLPVRLERSGEVPPGFAVESIEVTPDKVEVSGPASKLEGIRAVSTEPIDFSAIAAGGEREILRLVSPVDDEMVQLTPSEVLVEVQLGPVAVERELKGVNVGVRGGGEGWRVNPARIAVVVRGAEAEVGGLELRPGSVYVDVGGLPQTGTHRLKPVVELPDGIELVRRVPAEVTAQAPPARRGGGGRRTESRRD